MNIKTLEINNFRNYKTAEISFSPEVNILYGNNAQGKTNILEAVYFACTSKSQKGSKEKDIINFDSDESHIRVIFDKRGIDYKIDMHLKRGKTKGIAINGNPIKKASELYGLINIISFAPDDLQVIKSGPSERRKFIDMELCQLDKVYLYNLSNYNHILAQKNDLLKQISGNRSLKDTLDVWDEQLIKHGAYVIAARRKFISDINVIISGIHKTLTLGKERLALKYIPDSTEDNLSEKLFINRERDIILGSTSNGPHRDDIDFYINGEDVRKYGSQGQQRTSALSLKLSEIELVKNKTGDSPVLLLDDVLSELDRNRQTELLNSISDIQTIITCTGLEEFISNRMKCNNVYHVENGTIKQVNDIE